MPALFHATAFRLLLAVTMLLSAAGAGAEGLGGGSTGTHTYETVLPLRVEVGIKIDQITFVDQKSENFGVVGEIRLDWQDDLLAFRPVEGALGSVAMTVDEYLARAREVSSVPPSFLLQNQQQRRFALQETIILRENGSLTYLERFSTTLQAPYFQFRKYPFDTQRFQVELTAVYPTGVLQFVPSEQYSGLGDLLGEEEWVLHNARLETDTVNGLTGRESSQVRLVFDADRHTQYYMLRIMLPLVILLIVSWGTFFLEEYRRRIDMAVTNLLTFVAFNFAISGSLPRLGYVTFLDAILAAMFVITGSTVLVNILLRRLKTDGKEELAKRVDSYLVLWIYPLAYAGFLFWAVRTYLL